METPPEYAPYPRPRALPSGIYPRPPGVHFEAIGIGWSLFAKAWGTWVCVAFIFAVPWMAVHGALIFVRTYFEFGAASWTPPDGISPSRVGVVEAWVASLLPGLLVDGFRAGLCSMAIRQVRGEPIKVRHVFGSFRQAPKILLIGVWITLPTMVLRVAFGEAGRVTGWVLWLVMNPLLALAPFIAIDQNVSGRVASQLSLKALGGFQNRLAMLLLFVVLVLVQVCGAFALLLGFLVALPVCTCTMAVHYCYFFPERFPLDQPTHGQS